MQQELIDKVLAQIVQDVRDGDVTAIEEMLKSVSEETLNAFLPEDINIDDILYTGE